MKAEQEKRIAEAKSYIEELFRNNAGGHDADHSLRVYRNAVMIAEEIRAGGKAEPDPEIVALGALLHDADDHKLFQTENNANARRFLEETGLSAERVDRILAVINGVSFSQNQGKVPSTVEGKIVQDADRLDALGAIGVARTFAFGGEHGRSPAQSVQHFYDKLLLLKGTMNTEEAKRMAEKRHRFLEAFLSELDEETGFKGKEETEDDKKRTDPERV